MYMYRCHDSQTTVLPADVITAQRAVDANDVIAHCTDVSKVRIRRKHVLQNDANNAEFLNQGIYTVGHKKTHQNVFRHNFSKTRRILNKFGRMLLK